MEMKEGKRRVSNFELHGLREKVLYYHKHGSKHMFFFTRFDQNIYFFF